MEKKSCQRFFVFMAVCIFLSGIAVARANAQWWLSSSSTSSSSTSSSSTGSTLIDPAATGSYSTCSYTPPGNTGYSDPMIYYPCSSTGKLSSTTLSAGSGTSHADLKWLATHLVSHGYIVFAVNPTDHSGANTLWTTAQTAAIAQLKKENTRWATSASPNPLRGKINTSRLQVMGYDKGGGSALLAAASLGNGIKTVQALAPVIDTSYSLTGIRVSTAFYTSNCDTVATQALVSAMNKALPSGIDHSYYKFDRPMTHDHWLNQSASSFYGNQIKRQVTAFMKYFLDGNTAYERYLAPAGSCTLYRTKSDGSSTSTSSSSSGGGCPSTSASVGCSLISDLPVVPM